VVLHLTQVNNFLTKYKHNINSLASQENQKGIFLTNIPQRGILVKCILDKFSIIFAKEQKNGTGARFGCQAIDPVCKMVLNPTEAPANFTYHDRTYYFDIVQKVRLYDVTDTI